MRLAMPVNRAALIAGVSLLVMAVVAFAAAAMFDSVVVDGDPALAARTIADHGLRLRVVVAGYLVVAVLDVVVAWALYRLLEPARRDLALLAAWLRVVYAAAFVVAIFELATAAQSADPQAAAASVDAFQDGWNLALGVFGSHLVLVGYLLFASGYVPRLIGALVVIAGVGYLADTFASVVASPDVRVATVTFVGEVVLMMWLLIWGRSLQAAPDPSATADVR